MRILVTGGAGYIGSHTAALLLQRGDEVIVYDNLSTGDRRSIPARAEFVFGDIRDGELLLRVLRDRKVDAVIHFAARLVVPESMTNPWDYYDTNVCGGLQVIGACLKSGVRNLIFSSTAAVYGESSEPVTEASPTDPINPYGASKLMIERVLSDVGKAHPEFRWVALRYFNVAGAALDGGNGQRTPNATHLIKVAAETAVGRRKALHVFGTDYPTKDGTCIRDFIHVEDLAEAHIVALEALATERVRGEIYNCGYGQGASVLDVVASMERAAGNRLPIVEDPRRAGDPVQVVADSVRIKSELRWSPSRQSLDLICRTSYDWERRQ